jgi:hypothetical protein
MAISSSSPFAERTETMPTTKLDDNNEVKMVCQIPKEGLGREAPPKTSINTSISDSPSEGNSPIDEFASDNNIPTETDLKTIENLSVLDQNGRLVQFKDIYTGSNVARRVLVIFVRHFFCGVCSLSPSAIPPPKPQHRLTSNRTARNFSELSPNPSLPTTFFTSKSQLS